jgi:hypothetical protein
MSHTSLTETIYALVVKENAMAAWKWLCKNDLSKKAFKSANKSLLLANIFW